MKVCVFFGHADSPHSLQPKIREAVRELITEHQVDTFYVGSQGNFDRMALVELAKLSKEYPHIHYAIVLAYLPQKRREFEIAEENTFLPEGIEEVHPRYAVSWRNNWMADHADFVICFSKYSGRSARYITRAERKGCTIIRLNRDT